MIKITSYELYLEIIRVLEADWYTSLSDWVSDYYDNDWVYLELDAYGKTYNTLTFDHDLQCYL
jgi:hypothetical protein